MDKKACLQGLMSFRFSFLCNVIWTEVCVIWNILGETSENRECVVILKNRRNKAKARREKVSRLDGRRKQSTQHPPVTEAWNRVWCLQQVSPSLCAAGRELRGQHLLSESISSVRLVRSSSGVQIEELSTRYQTISPRQGKAPTNLELVGRNLSVGEDWT